MSQPILCRALSRWRMFERSLVLPQHFGGDVASKRSREAHVGARYPRIDFDDDRTSVLAQDEIDSDVAAQAGNRARDRPRELGELAGTRVVVAHVDVDAAVANVAAGRHVDALPVHAEQFRASALSAEQRETERGAVFPDLRDALAPARLSPCAIIERRGTRGMHPCFAGTGAIVGLHDEAQVTGMPGIAIGGIARHRDAVAPQTFARRTLASRDPDRFGTAADPLGVRDALAQRG